MRRVLHAGLLGLSALLASATAGAVTDKQNFEQIERGAYLALVSDCQACHTEPGGPPYGGGRAIETPFGNVLAPNLTPDKQTGIGNMTDDEFVDALTKGTSRGGEHLYPAMPYTYLTKMSREDALAIRAYLDTALPVQNQVKSNQLPFPFNIRASMVAWNTLFFTPGQYKPDPSKSAEWNRGAYLVEGPMHCGMCHTPKNFLGGDETSHSLTGYSLQGWFAPDITEEGRRGLGQWSIEDIVVYLKTGHNRFSAASGPMGEEVTRSSSRLLDSDLRAVAVYLKDRAAPAESSPTAVAAEKPAMKMGAAIFGDECAPCHTPAGKGIPSLFPDLAGSPAIQSREPTSILRVILDGTRSVGTSGAPTAPAMPGFRRLLNDDEVAAVATYIRNAWGNAAPAVSASDVKDMRQSLAGRVD